MTAGAAAMFVVVGGSAAGVATVLAPAPEDVTTAVAEPDLGAPKLEDDPEVVSRAAAAAQPLTPRHGATPVPRKPPVKVTRPQARRVPNRAAAVRAPARQVTTNDRLSRERVDDDRADRTGPRPARTTASVSGGEARSEPVARTPVVTTRTDVETRVVPFGTEVIRDATMLKGTRRVEADGEPGEETLRFLVTLTDGRPTARRLLSSNVTTEPQNRVVAVGSRRQSVVDPFCDHVLGICLPFGRSAE
ncbi:MAG TPA: G5 domain-containing protein [Actinoplanes sp.]|nr:G5 domain-containing protein [Actinoplanes sp.]